MPSGPSADAHERERRRHGQPPDESWRAAPPVHAGVFRVENRLKIAQRAAWSLLACQLAAMLSLSWVIYHRWSNTWDYAIRYQGWWGIAHGNLDPFSSVAGRFFLQDHFELINWPLAPLSLLWPHGLWPLWIQDLMVAGAEVAAVLMVADTVRRREWSLRIPGWLAVALVSVMLVANPWIYESIAFDFHYQTVGAACFALLTCREMIGGSPRRLIVWSALCLACGDIAATYLAAVGMGGILAGGTQRRRGTALLAAGVAWFFVVLGVGADQGSKFFGHYGYLAGVAPGTAVGLGALVKGIVTHPGRGLSHLWSQRVDLWAYAASAGLIGLCTPWAVLPIVVLLENGLASGTGVTGTAYENFGAVLFLVPLSVLALGRLDRRLEARAAQRPGGAPERALGHVVGPALLALIGIYAAAWGVLWIPRVPGRWVRVSPPAAAALDAVERLVPARSEVIASQGVVGRFADRRWLYRFSGAATFPLETPDTYFVIVPDQGIELASSQESEALIAQLTGPLHARLLLRRAGVWLFELVRGELTSMTLERHVTSLPAWVGDSATGTRVLAGPVARWHVAQTTSGSGYLLSGIRWDELPGRYRLRATLANRSPVELEVWDASADALLATRRVAPAAGIATVEVPLAVTREVRDQPYTGFWPFRFVPTRPPPGDRIEVRLVSSGSGPVDVYRVALSAAPG